MCTGSQKNIAYHYCSINALYGIISNKSIWLTSLVSTNDSKELKLGEPILSKALEILINNEQDKKAKKKYEILNKIKSIYNADKTYFGSSFVKTKDNLTHWDRYGNESKGVCICFNLDRLDLLLKPKENPDITTSLIDSHKIVYNEKNQIELTQKIIKQEILFFQKLIRKDLLKSNYLDLTFNTIYNSILRTITPIFKHYCFKDEEEYRIYYKDFQLENEIATLKDMTDTPKIKEYLDNLNDLMNHLNLNKSNRKISLIGDTIRSYYSLNLTEIWDNIFIPEITLGSRCNQSKKELQLFLADNGLSKTKIVVADTSKVYSY